MTIVCLSGHIRTQDQRAMPTCLMPLDAHEFGDPESSKRPGSGPGPLADHNVDTDSNGQAAVLTNKRTYKLTMCQPAAGGSLSCMFGTLNLADSESLP